ncbi:MAG: DUF2442 domain-containing protein [Alphaproteobacteria bacterium]|nr:DUF2442 domain-containing protein [Alphaproteobacteria bacterium]
MMPRIAKSIAEPDALLRIQWQDGRAEVIDFKPIIALGGVMKALSDQTFFSTGFTVDPDGYSVGWLSLPSSPDEVGGIDFSARGLWYRAHPEDLKRDHPAAAE